MDVNEEFNSSEELTDSDSDEELHVSVLRMKRLSKSYMCFLQSDIAKMKTMKNELEVRTLREGYSETRLLRATSL